MGSGELSLPVLLSCRLLVELTERCENVDHWLLFITFCDKSCILNVLEYDEINDMSQTFLLYSQTLAEKIEVVCLQRHDEFHMIQGC